MFKISVHLPSYRKIKSGIPLFGPLYIDFIIFCRSATKETLNLNNFYRNDLRLT